MPIPDFQTVMRPVLESVRHGQPLALGDVRQHVANAFQLTEEERKQRGVVHSQPLFQARILFL